MNRWIPFTVGAAIVVADRWTKVLIESRLNFWDTVPIVPGIINLVYTRNRGMAFGLLNDASEPVRTALLIGASTFIAAFVARLAWRSESDRWPLALVLAGAIGNLYDRVVHGSVTDFIQVFLGSYEWPSFNVADSAISVGAVWLALGILKSGPKTARA